MKALSSTPNSAYNKPLRGILLRIGSMAALAVMSVMVKLLSEANLPEAQMIFFRSFFGLIPVIFWIALTRRTSMLRTKRPMAHVIRAVIGLSSMLCMFAGLTRMSLSDATAISFVTPIFATIMSAVLLGEHIGLHRMLAILAGFTGVVILTGAGTDAMLGSGPIFILVGAFLGAAVSVTIRQISQTEHSVTITFYFMLAGVLMTGMALPFIWVPPPRETWPLLLVLGLAGGSMQIMLSASLRYAPVSVVMPFDYIQIVFVGFLSWAIWADLPTWRTLTGGLIIISSGLYIFYREIVRRVPPSRAASPADEG